MQSPGPSLPFTAGQRVCTIANDGNQFTSSVAIYSSQRLLNGHTSTLDNASGLNSFSSYVPSFGQLSTCGILGNQTFRPDVTSASKIQTDQGSTTPTDFEQFLSSMDMFCESVQPSMDAINKRIDSIVTTNNNGYGKRSLPTSNGTYPPAKRLRSPQQFSVPSTCDQLEN